MLLAFTGFVANSSLIGLLDMEVSYVKFGRSVCFFVLYGTVGTDGTAPGECSDVNPLKIPFPALVQFQS